jgi:hypothetical protein
MNLTQSAKSIAPPSLWRVLKKLKFLFIRSIQNSAALAGFTIARKSDYYSPLPVRSELLATRSLWDKPSRLRGIDYDLPEMQRLLRHLFATYGAELRALPSEEECQQAGYGPGFPLIDGRVLYGLLRELKPHCYLEIGSGLSTYFASLGAGKNEAEGRHLKINCVEPYPYPALARIPGIEVNARKVQEVELDRFAELQSGDILFIDSSHSLKVGSDVAYLINEVLPTLKAGVYIHIHDIPFPYNTPYPADQCIFGENWPLYFNEAMAVQAFLAFNSKYRIFLSCPLLRHFHPGWIEEQVASAHLAQQKGGTYSSLWLKKIAD